MRRKAGVIATLALVFATWLSVKVVCRDIPGGSVAGEPVGVGTPVAMKFTALDGREVDTEKMLGKVILVHFWATWSGTYEETILPAQKAYQEYRDKGLEIIGINVDTEKEVVEKLIADKGIPWPQYFDGKEWENRFVRQFGVKTVPTTWLIGKDGKLAHSDVDWSDPGPKVKRALEGLPLTDEQPGPAWPGLSEADKKALADFKEAYALAEGQNLKFMGQPFLPCRLVYYRLTSPTQAQLTPRGPHAYYFSWGEGLEQYGMSFGKPDLRTVLGMVARTKASRIEGDEELLGTGISADFIVREGVPAEKIVGDLEAMLRRDLRLPVKMGFREVEREVIVARGSYRFTPVPDRPPDRIEVYAEKLDDPSLGGGWSGDFVKFLGSVGSYLDKRVVNEVEPPPEGVLRWHESFREEGRKTPELVLQHLTEQTGLKFTKETRRVRVLFVERTD